MSDEDKELQLQVTHEFFNTAREIRKIERQVLAKRGARTPEGPFCSFCNSAKEEVPVLIHGQGDAYVCSNCERMIGSMEKDENESQP